MISKIYNAGLIGIGVNIPEEIRTNDYWDKYPLVKVKEGRDPFEGIKERRVFPEDALPSDVEVVAAERAISDAGIEKDEIDLVIVHSMLQDEIIPGNASLVQHKLGLKNAAAWNMDTCCSTFVTMFITASHLIALGTYKNILIVTSVLHRHMLDYGHYFSPSMGDGASAAVVSRVSEGRGYIASHCCSKGQYHDAFTMREVMPAGQHRVHYQGSPSKPVLVFDEEKSRQVGKNSVKDMTENIMKTLQKADKQVSDIDFMLTHQPVHWSHDAWREGIGLPEGKSHQTFSKYGNLASTSIPVSMHEAIQLGKLKDDDLILIASSGAGENFSIALLKWGK